MNNKFKVTIFGILLIMLMSVAVAAEVSDDTTTVDTIAEEVEPVATEVTSPQTDNILEENDIETDMVYSGDNPQTFSTLENETTYENAEITLSDDVTYSDAQVTFGNNVTLTANGKTLTNVKININGNNVTISNVIFNHNTTSDTKVINIDHASNVTLNNVNINLYKTNLTEWDSYETKAISITNSSCVKVNSSNIEVSTQSQALAWKTNDNWVTYWSELNVAAVVIDQSTGVCFTNNNVNIYNNTLNLDGTTMPGIIVRYGTNNSCIKNNNINVTGSHYNYGIMCSDYVSNLSIRDNDIRVTGEKNVVGIDASTSTGSVVYNNTIYANSTNTVGLNDGEQSLAYGILTNTYYNGNANNYVAYNTINLTGTVCYGIENYMGNNNTFNHNTVNATGTTAMGLGSWGSTDCKIINNNFIITGSDTVANTFYEQISPQNVGIILTGNTTYPSTNNLITGNTVNLTYFAGWGDVFTIVITNESTSNTIYNNSLTDFSNNKNGNSTVSINSSNNNVESNDNCTEYEFDDSNLLVCNCACCSQISTTQDVETISFFKKRNVLVKTSSSPIFLNSENFNQYVTNGLLNDNVTEGDVIDIDGVLEGSKYAFSVNKPVNITSSKGNAYLIFNSSSKGDQYIFNIIESGSGSNITNINFHNTHVRTEGAANVTFNNISLTCDKGIGFGVGAISIRSSDNVNITNSYFKSKSNSGHSTVVYATSNNCLFENNTVLGEGYVGNLFYITTYGGSGFSYNITIRNNYIDNTQAYNQSICQAMVISGAGHLIENNTIVANEWALGIQYYDPEFGEEGNPGEGTSIVKDNYIVQGRMAKTENVTYVNNVLPAEILVINDENWDKYLFFIPNEGMNTDINFTSIENTNLKIIYNATKRVNFNSLKITSPIENYVSKNNTGIRIITANEQVNNLYTLHNNTGYYAPYSYLTSPTTLNPIYDSIIKATMRVNVYNTFFLDGNSAILVDNEYMQYANSRPKNPVTYQIVTNENYMNYFDEETGIIKDDLSSYNFVIDGEINKSLIFNKSVNLRGFNNIEGYTLIKNSTLNNVKFIEGSENSNISCLKINNLTIQDTSNINIANNTIDGLLILNNSQSCKIISNDMDVAGRRITHPDSNIILYGSVNNIIKDNIIRTHGRFAISLDNSSYENLIEDNDLSSSGSYIMAYGKSFFDYYGKECIENNGTNTLFNNSINPKYNLKLNTKTFAVNQENTLNVNVNCEEFTVTNGKVIFSLNGTYLGEANVEKGVASLTFTPTALGSSSLSAWYVSDELDMPKGLTETATVKDLIETKVLIDYSGKVNRESFVTFTVTDEDGNPINDGQLTYSFNNGEEKTITLTENTVTIPLEDTEHIAGKYVKVTYTPIDSKYSSQTNTTTLDLEKANTQFTAVYDVIDDNNGNLTITLTDEFGN
ncbi:Ig-like domain-containing protein, partial [Methanosphaera sp.]|uniref:Ig-like domain-containing protein n=1 Tax=Methanosphaera sp. TaxID=2666342 RepID=UPI0025EB4FF3